MKTISSKLIRRYLTQDLSFEEKESYLSYINGNHDSNRWIEKSSIRRDYLLSLNIKCTTPLEGNICGSFIDVFENGICTCNRGHNCNDPVLAVIQSL